MSSQPIDKSLLKSVLEEMLAERNPELGRVLEELGENLVRKTCH